jgi:hypothetical protein
MTRSLPRFVRAKTLLSGVTAFFWECPNYYRKQGCPISSEPLGTDYVAACGENADSSRAATLNGLFYEWKAKKNGEAIAGLPSTFTLDACRHGGMTELEEAELTDGQGRALSAHKSSAYEGYAKRTMKRALAATRKRHAHRLGNEMGTDFRNDHQKPFRNDEKRTKQDAK